jgi:hypothetical protein
MYDNPDIVGENAPNPYEVIARSWQQVIDVILPTKDRHPETGEILDYE